MADGDLDVVVTNSLHGGGQYTYLNEGGGVFSKLSQEVVPGATGRSRWHGSPLCRETR